MSLLLIGFVLRISRHWNYVSRKFEFGLVLPQSISSKFQNSFTAEFWRTFWLRTSASTIALKFLGHTCYINKSWYQKFQAKTLAKCFTKCNFLQNMGSIQLRADFIKNTQQQWNRIIFPYCRMIAVVHRKFCCHRVQTENFMAKISP